MNIKMDKRDLKKILDCLESQAQSCDCYGLHDEEQEIYMLMGKLERAMENGK